MRADAIYDIWHAKVESDLIFQFQEKSIVERKK